MLSTFLFSILILTGILCLRFYIKNNTYKNFFKEIKSSLVQAVEGKSFRPISNQDVNSEFTDSVKSLNDIYAQLKGLQVLSNEKKELEERNRGLEHSLSTTKNSVNYLNVIGELGQSISSTLSLTEVIQILSKSIRSMMNASGVEIGLYDKQHEKLKFRSDLGIPTFTSSQAQTIYSTVFSEWSITNKKDVFLLDVEKNFARYVYKLPDFAGKIPQSLICCPMISENRITGTIGIISFEKDAFSSNHFDMVKALVPYATLAIENAKGYEELSHMQQQLVHQEKMASLGQLTAGVAHEINNPINFVSANVTPLKRDIDDILKLLEKYSSLTAENYQAKLLEIKEYSNSIDLNYTLNEIKSLLKGIEEGSRRTAEIVRGLKNFSRSDEDSLKKTDINEGISSTLLLLQSKFKMKRIELVKTFENLPLTECNPGQINQVLMNIISNAIDATEDHGKISVSTAKESNWIRINIKDNGKGMSEDIIKNIFDPFFTTKDVGRGTGLGLSISYGIIEKHKGRIEVQSEPEKGTQFSIYLPIV